jgi:DUF4097 and DUF4098 domain-containing protein YvlB
MRVILVASMLMALSVPVSGKSFRFEYAKKINVPPKTRLIMTNFSGDIEVYGENSGDQIIINAVKNVKGGDADEAERMAECIRIDVSLAGSRLTIASHYLETPEQPRSFLDRLFGKGPDIVGSVDYTLQIPVDCDVDIVNNSGNISVSDIKGSVCISGESTGLKLRDIRNYTDISVISGDIDLSEITGDVDIRAASSDMKLKEITGAINIESTSGDKKASFITGPLRISQTSGRTELLNLKGNLHVESTSGDIFIEQDSGAIDIKTISGDIEIKTRLVADRDFFVETSSGDILFSVPEASSGKIKLETVSGVIRVKMPIDIKRSEENKLDGSFGTDGPMISMITLSGDIIVGQH